MTRLTRIAVPVFAVLILCTVQTHAVIKVTSPLRLFVRDATQIVQVRVTMFDAEKSRLTFEVVCAATSAAAANIRARTALVAPDIRIWVPAVVLVGRMGTAETSGKAPVAGKLLHRLWLRSSRHA